MHHEVTASYEAVVEGKLAMLLRISSGRDV